MSATEQELRTLYNAWMEAIQVKDLARLEEIIGHEYVYTASNQGRFSRSQWFSNVANYDIQSFDLGSIQVLPYDDVVVAVIEIRQTAVFNGAPRSGDFLITDVWVHREGRWQVVARSSILMPPKD